MLPSNENKSFLDRGTLTAIILVMVFWFGWSKWMESKYPTVPSAQQVTSPGASVNQTAPTQQKMGVAPGTSEIPVASGPSSGSAEISKTPEGIVHYDSPNLAFDVSSKGMGLKNINVKAYKGRGGEPIILGKSSQNAPYATGLVGIVGVLDFVIEQPKPGTFVGRALADGMTIQKTITMDSHDYSFKVAIEVTGAPLTFRGLTTYLSDIAPENSTRSWLNPAVEQEEFLFIAEGTKARQPLVNNQVINLNTKNVSILALSNHYFTMALMDRSPLMPSFEASIPENAKEVMGHLQYVPVNAAPEFRVNYDAFAGPKDLEALAAVDEQMTQVIDYGMFAWIAKPLLWLLRFLNTFFHNFGVSIILLTIIVRFIVLPFNMYSFKSMKVMQKLQPEMQRLRERYKGDSQTLNREIMALMKEHKANPLGGCLPMLLQLPVFFALYQVLGQSIELYQAPFIWWIQDLSVKDSFYVLPVLMGITMYIQQRITPTTMDPAQAKVMQIMPVIFSFLMIGLPSGLTLYIFVSTLFGIIQQYMFMREKSPGTNISRVQA